MRPGRHPRRVFGLMVAVVLSAARPSPAAAADPIELPGDSIAAVVVDLDGDGEREVVRLVRSSSDGVEVDAWHHGPRGWDTIRGSDLRSDPERDAGGLLRARHGESDRLLAVTAEPIPGDEFGAVCCLSLHEVRQEDGVLTLAPVAADDLDRGAIYIQSLDLDADGTDELELGARITGSVSPYAELMVDGHPVEVNDDGAFEVAVDAPPWPIEVVVVARDPLGNETSASVQVIGVVDYRGLPWLPIMGLLTALVGAYALLRVPRPGARPAPAWTDDSTLEDIELE